MTQDEEPSMRPSSVATSAGVWVFDGGIVVEHLSTRPAIIVSGKNTGRHL
jgi:hypothetical protein